LFSSLPTISIVDQIRRSSIAAHLPEAKRLLLNHPLLKDQIDFEA